MSIKEGYIEKDQRKKILFLCDDIRMFSGVSLMAREIITGTAHQFRWVNVGGSVNHPEEGKRLDISKATNIQVGIEDSEVFIYPVTGYGNPEIIRNLIQIEKPDAIMIFTDPRYWIWLFQMEHEIRQEIPLIYLNIWDNDPAPLYNKPYYESCDALFAISKLTERMNHEVLGEEIASEKVIKYIPHGIDENKFFPILGTDYDLEQFKDNLFEGKEYDFVLLYNARNLRRKSVSDLLRAWCIFVTLDSNKDKNYAFVLHTNPIDENGTDLYAVVDMLTKGDPKYNIIFHEEKLSPQGMNLLYNSCDATILTSSNEGWGLSLTESMMCEKPIIATATGGMSDQMKLENGKSRGLKGFDIELDALYRVNDHTSRGSWAIPVFPTNRSIIGSVDTPYIYDDRVDPYDISEAIATMKYRKEYQPLEYEKMGKDARKWVTSDESMMSAKNMCKNIFEGINETLEKFTPRSKYEIIKL